MMKANLWLAGVIAGLLMVGIRAPQVVTAQEAEQGHDHAALLNALPKSKLSLADGIRQAAKSSGMPISAKFEMDDSGRLSLSVYTAEKGLTTDAEHNTLKELSGSPESAQWNPKVETFEDAEHLKRSAEQQALMAISPFSLLNIIAKAEKQRKGTVFSITPVVRDRKPEFIVLVADNGRVTELAYDLIRGGAINQRK